MRGRSRLLPLLAITLTLCASAADVLSSVAIMACCQKTDFTCAGMKTPDDCCRTMQHAGPQGLATTRSVSTIDAHPVAILPEPMVLADVVVGLAPAAPFTRPHDPPHLHHFNLLI